MRQDLPRFDCGDDADSCVHLFILLAALGGSVFLSYVLVIEARPTMTKREILADDDGR